jgi:hypothetical protein
MLMFMATTNDITGDSLRSRVSSTEYLDNFDAIFRKPKAPTVGSATVPADKPMVTPEADHQPHHTCPCKHCDDYWLALEKRMDVIGQNGNDGY